MLPALLLLLAHGASPPVTAAAAAAVRGNAAVERPVPPAEAADPAWQTLPEALAAARQSGRPVLVYVHARSCGPCRRMERTAFRDAGVRALLGRFALARLDLDDHESTLVVGGRRDSPFGWARQIGAEATPSFVFLAPDGTPITRASGYVATERFARLLAFVATGAHRRMDFGAYVRETGG